MAAPAPAPVPERAPLIELRHVTVRAHDGHDVLHGISLALGEGEVLGLVFVHGTGKTTLLRAASGFFKPDAGAVLFRGRPVHDLDFAGDQALQSKIGFVFQNGGLLVNTRVFDNVALPLRYHTRLGEKEIEGRVGAALAQVGMEAAAQKFPWELTVARQKLVGLARALVREPEVILFDNFVTGTETGVWELMIRTVRQARAGRRVAWMLVLEADPDVYALADRIAVIEDGRLLAIDEPRKLEASADARVRHVFRATDFGRDT